LWYLKIFVVKRSLIRRKEYSKALEMPLKEWLMHYQQIHFNKSSWMGIRALKNPLDAWIYQEIIYEVKPDVIIEIGSKEGGSTLFLANLLDAIGKGQVISIDINRSDFLAKHPRIIEITGNSSSQDIVLKVSELCRDKSVLVIHDADHHKEQVLRDLTLYSALVSLNSYFIVEDSIVDLYGSLGFPGWSAGQEGPLAAIEEFLQSNPRFIADKEKERYILTYNPKGFLKRIK
jgi:cephalosporin hydroxylase